MKEKKKEKTNVEQGLLAQFADEDQLVAACEKVRDAGFTKWDAFSPFPVHGIDEAMGIKRSRLQYVTIAGGFVGAGAGLLMQWWMIAIDYPFRLGGKPPFSLPAFIPVMFETTILFAALGTFFGMLMFAGLPRLYHAVFTSRRFARASQDGFFINIEAADPKYDKDAVRKLLEDSGGTNIEVLEDLA